jgi:hypothetical protein
MTTVGHPPRLLHGHAATHEFRWVKADGISDSPPIASGLLHRGFVRGQHNSSGTWFMHQRVAIGVLDERCNLRFTAP